jgi:hypothetical protein
MIAAAFFHQHFRGGTPQSIVVGVCARELGSPKVIYDELFIIEGSLIGWYLGLDWSIKEKLVVNGALVPITAGVQQELAVWVINLDPWTHQALDKALNNLV